MNTQKVKASQKEWKQNYECTHGWITIKRICDTCDTPEDIETAISSSGAIDGFADNRKKLIEEKIKDQFDYDVDLVSNTA